MKQPLPAATPALEKRRTLSRRSRQLGLAMALAACAVACSPNAARAQSYTTSFVYLGKGVPGVLYQPAEPGPKAGISVLVMHAEADYLEAPPCRELVNRGYTVLCANTSVSKVHTGPDFSLEKILLDVKLAVGYLRHRSGIRKVVLLGHSGGGAMMAAYEDVAENGVSACQNAKLLLKCSDKLAGLPRADGVMLLDSNFGFGGMMLLSLDAAVTNEARPQRLDPALDLFNPVNGYNPRGSNYTAAFIARWQHAVAVRNSTLIRAAQARVAAIQAGKGVYDDDEPFTVPGAAYASFNNKLFAQDPALLSRTMHPWVLLHPGGRETTEIVHTVRVPENTMQTTGSLNDGALLTTVRNFLSAYAVGTGDDFHYGADGIDGADWAASYGNPISAIQGITAPLLVMGMTGHWEFMAAEPIYENAPSKDKSLAYVEGATHLFNTCKPCEKQPGQFGDTMKTLFDHVDQWLGSNGRF